MTHAGHARRLRRLEQRSARKDNPFLRAVYESDRRSRAVRAVAAFARALAGTDRVRAETAVPPSGDSAPETVPRADHAVPRGDRPVWSDAIRPGPHDVLTWEEAMRVPWLGGNTETGR